MLTYKEKLISDIAQMPEEQLKRLYIIFQTIRNLFKNKREAIIGKKTLEAFLYGTMTILMRFKKDSADGK